jgi:hypothetical protein
MSEALDLVTFLGPVDDHDIVHLQARYGAAVAPS